MPIKHGGHNITRGRISGQIVKRIIRNERWLFKVSLLWGWYYISLVSREVSTHGTVIVSPKYSSVGWVDIKVPADKIAISKFAFWLTFRLTFWFKGQTMYDEGVHAIFLCFPEAYQITILKIAFLSASVFIAWDWGGGQLEFTVQPEVATSTFRLQR